MRIVERTPIKDLEKKSWITAFGGTGGVNISKVILSSMNYQTDVVSQSVP
jgi:hypothetical protein